MGFNDVLEVYRVYYFAMLKLPQMPQDRHPYGIFYDNSNTMLRRGYTSPHV